MDLFTLLVLKPEILRSGSQTTSAISQLPPAVRAMTFDVQPSGLLCCWSVRLELAARQSTRPGTF